MKEWSRRPVLYRSVFIVVLCYGVMLPAEYEQNAFTKTEFITLRIAHQACAVPGSSVRLLTTQKIGQ